MGDKYLLLKAPKNTRAPIVVGCLDNKDLNNAGYLINLNYPDHHNPAHRSRCHLQQQLQVWALALALVVLRPFIGLYSGKGCMGGSGLRRRSSKYWRICASFSTTIGLSTNSSWVSSLIMARCSSTETKVNMIGK